MAVQKLGVLTAGRSMCSTRRSQADGALTPIKVALRPHMLFLLTITFILYGDYNNKIAILPSLWAICKAYGDLHAVRECPIGRVSGPMVHVELAS